LFVKALNLLEAGNATQARQTWTGFSGYTLDYTSYHILTALVEQAAGNSAQVQAELQAAQRVAGTPSDTGWLHLAAGLLNPDRFDQEIAAAKDALEIAPTGNDWALGANIAYIQYLALAIPRQFLPQVGYSEVDLSLTHLLGDADALAYLRTVMQR